MPSELTNTIEQLVVLTNTKNNIQLNAMLSEGILDHFTEEHRRTPLTLQVSAMWTGGLRIDRHDLSSTHEEADILIAQHAISLLLLDKSVRVDCADAGVCATISQ